MVGGGAAKTRGMWCMLRAMRTRSAVSDTVARVGTGTRASALGEVKVCLTAATCTAPAVFLLHLAPGASRCSGVRRDRLQYHGRADAGGHRRTRRGRRHTLRLRHRRRHRHRHRHLSEVESPGAQNSLYLDVSVERAVLVKGPTRCAHEPAAPPAAPGCSGARGPPLDRLNLEPAPAARARRDC